ncbi:MAG: anthranilate phosphoribosyltransferase, partial [Myxococcales bacterium]|nr:anthranilate phosphoribosyltransferase [Myxococcales bacterium]
DDILGGRATPDQIAALAVALRMRGETPEEIASAARVMRQRCDRVDLHLPSPLMDTCGTGGDGAGSFNVSTTAAIVVAAAGVAVAKHGNRAVSSRSGSADLLEALGVRIELSKGEVAECIQEVGIGFFFAPAFHGALKHAAPVRRRLGIRTFFNLLGPLANPAAATHQLLGVYDPGRVRQMAEVLLLLGTEGAWVVHGEGGLDEVSPYGPTRVAALRDGEITEFSVRPEDFGMDPVPAGSIGGGDAEENAGIARAVLEGTPSPYRDAVVINAAAALMVAGRATDMPAARAMAEGVIDDGRARSTLESWSRF